MLDHNYCCSLIRTKGFYVNGICNQPDHAQDTVDSIRHIVDQVVRGDFFDIELHYNGTCTSLACVANLSKVQVGKRALANQLVGRIRCALCHQGYGRIALFAHSQGADVVRMLKEEMICPCVWEQYISVVTIGPKINVDGGENYQHKSDWISRLGNFISPFPQSKAERPDSIGKCSTFLCHGTKDYLNRKNVQEAIVRAATGLRVRMRKAVDPTPPQIFYCPVSYTSTWAGR